jgi:NitT/TauT family transport system permease protein
MWEAAYRVFGWHADVFPAPFQVIHAIGSMLGGQEGFFQRPLVQANIASGIRLVIGFVVTFVIGAMSGAILWRWREVDQLLGPLLLGLQALPSVCWVPLGLILLGANERGILFVMVMGSFSGVAISMREGLRTIPPLYRRAGMMLGARGWRMYRYVLLPASLPALAGSLRQGFSFAWRSLMGAEVLFAVQGHGLGFLLQKAKNLHDAAAIVAVMIMMLLIAMLVDRFGFAKLEQRIATRFGFAA